MAKLLGKGTAKPGEDFKYKGWSVNRFIAIYKVYAQNINGNKALIASGRIKNRQ
ncbi:MAG: hypothetical protein R3F37_05950 [Candidatus Competibacteraceae bacterium]